MFGQQILDETYTFIVFCIICNNASYVTLTSVCLRKYVCKGVYSVFGSVGI